MNEACPFCGTPFCEDEFPYPADRTNTCFIVGCTNPKCGFEADADTPDLARAKWNTRVHPEPAQAQVSDADKEAVLDAEEDGVRRAFDALDALAEEWADRCGVVSMAVNIAAMPDRTGRIVALAKLAWTEGAYTGRRSHAEAALSAPLPDGRS